MGRFMQVALVSGAARGIGAAIARLFAREGAAVTVADIRDAEGEQTAEDIRRQGGAASYQHLDVSREAEWVAVIAAAVSSHGKLNVLVNNAGVIVPKGIEETTEAEWDHVLDINAKARFSE